MVENRRDLVYPGPFETHVNIFEGRARRIRFLDPMSMLKERTEELQFHESSIDPIPQDRPEQESRKIPPSSQKSSQFHKNCKALTVPFLRPFS